MRRTGDYMTSRSYITAMTWYEALIEDWVRVTINIDQEWWGHEMGSCLSLKKSRLKGPVKK
jgi:hypothetical protein